MTGSTTSLPDQLLTAVDVVRSLGLAIVAVTHVTLVLKEGPAIGNAVVFGESRVEQWVVPMPNPAMGVEFLGGRSLAPVAQRAAEHLDGMMLEGRPRMCFVRLFFLLESLPGHTKMAARTSIDSIGRW